MVDPRAVSGATHYLYLMYGLFFHAPGDVYTWGCNDDGALGRVTTGSDDGEEYLPRKVALPEGVKVVKVSAGDSHTAALTTDGEVYAWGSYRDGSGVIGLTSTIVGKKGLHVKIFPTSADTTAVATKIASGNDHTVIMTDSGDIYTNGTGEQGQLGRVKECFGHRGGRRGLDKVLTPQRVRLRKKVYFTDIFCGSYSTYALCRDDPQVYAWGLNNYGQLGDGTTVNYYNPKVIDSLTQLRGTVDSHFCIGAGQQHAIVATGDGHTYAIGRAEYGRLGLGEGAAETSTPTIIPALEGVEVSSVACGEQVSFAVTKSGCLYSWGAATSLQLGVGEEDEDALEPTEVKSKNLNPETDEVLAVAAGGQHSVVLVRKR